MFNGFHWFSLVFIASRSKAIAYSSCLSVAPWPWALHLYSQLTDSTLLATCVACEAAPRAELFTRLDRLSLAVLKSVSSLAVSEALPDLGAAPQT